MRNKKLLLVLVLFVVAIFTIAGCGSATADKKAEEKTKGLVEQWKDTGHAKFFATWVNRSDAEVAAGHYGDNCIKCHSAVVMLDDKTAKFADFRTGGKYAGDKDKLEGISCRVCHKLGGADGITLKTPGWDACASCHTSGNKPTLGSEVHHPQGEMIKGIGVGEVKDSPSKKFGMKDFACYDCHVVDSTKHDFTVPGVTIKKDDKNPLVRVSTTIDYDKFKTLFDQEKCKSCHANPGDTVEKVKTQQAEVSKKLEELKKSYDELKKGLADKLVDPATKKPLAYKDVTDPKVKAFLEGSTYYTYVEADSSKGVHNYDFTKALLEKAEAKFKEVK